eukprot:4763305-Pleurochrysis_carterae.AAC.1
MKAQSGIYLPLHCLQRLHTLVGRLSRDDTCNSRGAMAWFGQPWSLSDALIWPLVTSGPTCVASVWVKMESAAAFSPELRARSKAPMKACVDPCVQANDKNKLKIQWNGLALAMLEFKLFGHI